MNITADLLMLQGMTRVCPDCGDERIFIPVDDAPGEADHGAFCCTSCGAAVLLDPDLSPAPAQPSTTHSRVA
ncbi:MAG: hypothetical protein ACRDQA_26120 [Nocardioidaceae bacterium]